MRISVFFPVYKDENTVRTVTAKALRLIAEQGGDGEIVIVDDDSPDRSGEIADALAREHPRIKVVHHETNLGYGAAVRSGIKCARGDFICMSDGDDQYEVEDFNKLLRLRWCRPSGGKARALIRRNHSTRSSALRREACPAIRRADAA